MKRAFVVAVMAVCGIVKADVQADSSGYAFAHLDSFLVASSLATHVAALTASSGAPLDRGGAAAAVVSAPSGQTITGGTMRCYVYMPVTATAPITYRWIPYAALDFALVTGIRDVPSGDKIAYTGTGRIVWVPDAVTLSSGTTITVTITYRKGFPK